MITLESGGLKVDLEVIGYKPNDTNWCRLDFHVYGDGIDLHYNSESMISLEIEELAYYLDKLLQRELTDTVSIYWMEPDYSFEFIPWISNCFRITCSLQRNRRSTHNSLDIVFDKKECGILYDYLTNEIGAQPKSHDESEADEEEKLYRYVSVVYDPEDIREYTYLDEDHVAEYDGRVWVPVGKDNKERIAYVVDIDDYTADEVPYPLDKVKKILRLATD